MLALISFDDLNVACTCCVELGCDELRMAMLCNALEPRTSDGQ